MNDTDTVLLHGLSEVTNELQSLKNWIVYQEKRINELDEILTRITQDDMLAGRKPYKCPICVENNMIPEEEYCVCCEGKRIVWG